MAVTADKYELPLCVGTCEEVAEWAGITKGSLKVLINRSKKGGNAGQLLGRKFVSVKQ